MSKVLAYARAPRHISRPGRRCRSGQESSAFELPSWRRPCPGAGWIDVPGNIELVWKPQLCGRHSDGRKFLLTDPRARSTVRAPLRRDLPRSLKTESYPARNRAGPERLLVSKLAGSSETNNMAAHLRRVVSVGVSNQAPHGNVSAEGFKLESLILAQNER